MRFSALSVTAICAILASASPVEKREPQQSDGFNVISASHSGLGKRFSLLSAGSVVINGQTIAPGSQPFPHVFVAGPGQPVCNIYCLNPAITTPDLVKSCQDRGCPISVSAILFFTSSLDLSLFLPPDDLFGICYQDKS